MRNILFFILLFILTAKIQSQHSGNQKILKYNWSIQSSEKIHSDGSIISKPGYNVNGWYPAIMPSTILETLVKNEVVKDPYYGNNLAESKGFFAADKYLYDMPENGPYSVPWWFRTEFELPSVNDYTWLNLSSINYKANIWLNGHLIANTNDIEGAHRLYEIDITKHALIGKNNCLAIEITPPLKGTDLSVRWMQGSRTVPDKNAGIWYDVKIIKNGTLKIRYPHVITDLNLPDTSKAVITLTAQILNQSEKDINGVINGVIRPVNNLAEGGSSSGGNESYDFAKSIFIAANTTKEVKVSIEIKNPNLWWPYMSGNQELYDLNLSVKPDEQSISDEQIIRFGIREVASYLEDYKHAGNQYVRIFKINGKNIFIKGGNWTETLMMENNPKRNEAEIFHMMNMNFNAIRTEGFWGADHFFDMCDKYGIMIFDGFNCCSIWEQWDQWSDRTFEIAGKSLRDQVIRKRNHPSFIDWLLGSDNPVPPKVEKMYVDIIEKYDGTRPYQSDAMYSTTTISGCTGLDHDPYPETYTYLPPSAWYGMKEKDDNGNFGTYEFFEFNTEVGPGGEVIPPIESLRSMMPEKDLWPKNKTWEMRYSPDSLSVSATDAFYKRYGQPTDLESYTVKAQVFQKESFRAMVEAFRKNKYKASGVLIYRLNAGWPSMCYYLYDYYLRPNGSYAGVQQGFEPLHALYAYDDHSVVVVNGLYQSFKNLKINVQIFNMDMTERYSNKVKLNIKSDGVKTIFKIPKIKNLSKTYFLNINLENASGDLVSSNFYWLTTGKDQDADFLDLDKLTPVKLQISANYQSNGSNSIVKLKITNPTNQLAFFINPKVLIGMHGKELLPSYWNTKYLSILPGKSRELEVKFNVAELNGYDPYLMLEGWNIEPIEIALNEINEEVTPILSYKNIKIPKNIMSGQKFDIDIIVSNSAKTGEALLKLQQYLYIDDKYVSFKRVAIAPGEEKNLRWKSIIINKLGKHTIKIGHCKPIEIIVR